VAYQIAEQTFTATLTIENPVTDTQL